MKTIEYHFVDKSTWPRGAWDSEPDKIQWQDKATGFPCLIVRNRELGHLCGYVGVPPEHPCYHEHYDDVTEVHDLDVHGGLTFAGVCQKSEHGICHLTEPGELDNVWWLGFDMAHGGDFVPGMYKFKPIPHYHANDVYRTVEYAKAQCERLAVQLATLARAWPGGNRNSNGKDN